MDMIDGRSMRDTRERKESSGVHCTLGHSSFAIFSKSIFKIIAQGENDTLFYTEFRTVFLFSVKFPILGGFRFEILKNQRGEKI